jgi:hypothetical protein
MVLGFLGGLDACYALLPPATVPAISHQDTAKIPSIDHQKPSINGQQAEQFLSLATVFP